ncbi:MFS transporter [Streptomyces sp. TRM 70351]|uniref:MFS transporter n=1 Tax=Streptomyces sp. TRM 70351 TaxID=3116552 RepID=UPI002E7B702C|nr:MFS transporter [Streptomyces sp. TRM 70351]MEE1931082.1 MFS transporter [Streptomyces sp. TRM 70351]
MTLSTGAERPAPLPDAGGAPGTTEAAAGPGLPGRWLVLVIVLSAVFMQFLDTTITIVAIPSMQADLNASFADVQLVVAVYALAFACMLITGGRLGDIYGRKRMFLIGMLGFTAASVMCGAAPSADFLVLSRVLQGLFSGLMFPQVLSIIQVTFGEREKPKALAFYGATIGLATVLGPVLGGWLVELDIAGSDWRSIFYVNVPVGLLALALGALRIRESAAETATRVDLTGVVIVTAGLFLLILPLVIGREHDWPAWSLAMIAASPFVLAWFWLVEKRKTARPDGSPLVPTTLFRDRSFTVGLVISLVFFTGIPSFFMTLFITLQIGFAYSAVSAGAVTLAFALLIAIGSARSAEVVKRLGTWTLALGTGLLVLGMGGVILTLSWAGTDLRGWYLVPALMVGGAGTGLVVAPITGIILEGIKSGDAGSASGVIATAQQVGIAIGIAVIGIIFSTLVASNSQASVEQVLPQLRQDLAAAGLPAERSGQVIAGFETCFHDRTHQKDLTAVPASCAEIERRAAGLPLPAQVKEDVRTAVLDTAAPEARKENFSSSFQGALLWQLGVFTLCCLLVLALPKVKPTRVLPGGA